ncbi:MAG TPA: hypothetical protein VMV69_16625 [Pirellulales bacterium]|nr:hypothetical protein [Pirellulales bacterium]
MSSADLPGANDVPPRMTLSGLPTYNTRRDQRLTAEEVRLLLVHLLWLPGLASAAEMIRICRDCFVTAIEAGHALLLGIVIQLRQQYGDTQVTWPMIEAELQRHFVGENLANPSGAYRDIYCEGHLLAWLQAFDGRSGVAQGRPGQARGPIATALSLPFDLTYVPRCQ